MRNPRETGISSITGKMLIIKHASESEQIDVADIMKKRAGESLELSRDDIVIASLGERLLGYAALMRDAPERDGGYLSLSDGRLQRGITRQMLRHLFAYSEVKDVSADRVAARHLIAMGFKRKRGSVRNKEGGSVLHNVIGGRGRDSSFIVARPSS
jgi:hypothetical protein